MGPYCNAPYYNGPFNLRPFNIGSFSMGPLHIYLNKQTIQMKEAVTEKTILVKTWVNNDKSTILCPVHLLGQNIFCPGQNNFCPDKKFCPKLKKYIFAREKDRK